jgi:hypothetical protein
MCTISLGQSLTKPEAKKSNPLKLQDIKCCPHADIPPHAADFSANISRTIGITFSP